MSDVRPLLDEGATELETALLLEARAQQPSAEALARTLRSVGVAGAAVVATTAIASTTVASTTHAAGTTSVLSLVAKVLGVIVVAGGIAGGVIYERRIAHETHTTAATSASTAAIATAPPSSEPAPPSSVDAPAASAEAPPDDPANEPPPEHREAHAPRATSAPAEPSARSLAPEIALIDQARAALKANKPAQALALLQRYRSQFGEGRLAPEADYLRIEAMMATGDRKSAEALAQKSLGADAHSPHAKRIRSLISADNDGAASGPKPRAGRAGPDSPPQR